LHRGANLGEDEFVGEPVDAVVGVGTHRDTHEVEIALPTGTPIGTRTIRNDNSGFAELLAWIGDLCREPTATGRCCVSCSALSL
jgi:hypothetical protein